jgi:hypothetical protein
LGKDGNCSVFRQGVLEKYRAIKANRVYRAIGIKWGKGYKDKKGKGVGEGTNLENILPFKLFNFHFFNLFALNALVAVFYFEKTTSPASISSSIGQRAGHSKYSSSPASRGGRLRCRIS